MADTEKKKVVKTPTPSPSVPNVTKETKKL